jgi:predicted glycoside hydrolase/deacetylase ChbG (UPF0249 family)
MQLVMRCDDFGYTEIFNLGFKKVLNEGIITHAEIMADTPGAVDAMETIKKYPWISVGWHIHWWGKPSAEPSKVRSLLDENGFFKFRRGMWNAAYETLSLDCNEEEFYIEMESEIQKFITHMGRAPDVVGAKPSNTPMGRALARVCDEFGIAVGAYTKVDMFIPGKIYPPSERFKDSKLYMPAQNFTVYAPRYSPDSYVRNCTYDPLGYMLNDVDHILEREATMIAWSPGYIDDYMLEDFMYWYKNDPMYFEPSMLKDITALCSPALREWIIKNKVELVSLTDAIYGTKNYQNYLRFNKNEDNIKK